MHPLFYEVNRRDQNVDVGHLPRTNWIDLGRCQGGKEGGEKVHDFASKFLIYDAEHKIRLTDLIDATKRLPQRLATQMSFFRLETTTSRVAVADVRAVPRIDWQSTHGSAEPTLRLALR